MPELSHGGPEFLPYLAVNSGFVFAIAYLIA